MLRLDILAILLHAYIGWRLLPDLVAVSLPAAAALALWLALSAWLMPQGLFARSKKHRALSDALVWAGAIAMGSLSSLFVLTMLRDVGLLAAAAVDLVSPGSIALGNLQSWSATAIPVLAAFLPLVGLYNARRRALVRSGDVAIAGPPAAPVRVRCTANSARSANAGSATATLEGVHGTADDVGTGGLATETPTSPP